MNALPFCKPLFLETFVCLAYLSIDRKHGKPKQIIKHYIHKQGTRKITDLTAISRNTVKKYIARFKELQRPWDEFSKLNDQDMGPV